MVMDVGKKPAFAIIGYHDSLGPQKPSNSRDILVLPSGLALH